MGNEEEWQVLLVKKYTGIANPEELKLIDHLIETNREVAEAWEDLRAQEASVEVQQLRSTIDHDAIYRKVIGRRLKRRRKYALSAAAILLVLVVAGTIFYRQQGGPVKPPDLSQVYITLANGQVSNLTDSTSFKIGDATFTTTKATAKFQSADNTGRENLLTIPNGKRYELTLSDGTHVMLNAGSSLSFPFNFTGSQRQITIAGQVFLSVASDNQHPFIVHTPQGSVTVLGTDFSISTYNQLEVSLAKGMVRIMTKKDTVELRPGQRARIDKRSGHLLVKNYDPETEFGWLNGEDFVDNYDVEMVAALLQRVYNVKVIFDAPPTRFSSYSFAIDSTLPLRSAITSLTLIKPYVFTLDAAGQVHIR